MTYFTRADWSIIQDMFDDLCDATPEQQEEALQRSEMTVRLQDEIKALLRAHANKGLLDTPWTEPLDEAPPPANILEAGQRIGPFQIVSLIGRGGMGEVYLGARVEGGFEQRAAIKVIRAERPEHRALFSAERRIVAGLEHPGIARVIDGGMTGDGRPFMAMEFVEGVPLTHWCKDQGLSLPARLRLFLDVCQAVAYAHRHLVIHRDIKPSNILVDAEGRARLLDFGVAQLVDETFGDDPLPITPEYAAPEQLRGEKSSTAMDVYGLGALLFELLVGQGPWQSANNKLPAFIRRLLEEVPKSASETAADLSNPCITGTLLKGDLDAIVAKALHHDQGQRYPSVEALVEDVERFLSFRPVEAVPKTLAYRTKLYVRRHTLAVSAFAALAVAIAGGVATTGWQAREAFIQRDIAQAEVKKTQAINQALALMFRTAGESASGRQTTVKAMIDKSAADIVGSFKDDEKQATEIILALADLYTNLEDQLGQAALLSAALDKGIGKDDPEATAHMNLGLAEAYIVLQRLPEAKPLLAKASQFYGANRAAYPKLYLQERGAEAALARLEGRSADGIAILRADMPAAKAAYADAPRELLARYNNLIVHLVEANKLAEAGFWLDEAEKQIQRLKQDNTQVANGIAQMRGGWQMRMGNKEGALATFSRVMTIRKDLYGPSSGLAMDMLQVGRTLVMLERPREAIPVLEEARAMAAQFMGDKNVPSLVLNVNLCLAYAKLGQVKEAEAALERARPIAGSLPPGSPPWALFKQAEAVVFLKKGQARGATSALDAAQAAFEKQGALGAPYLVSIKALRAELAKQ